MREFWDWLGRVIMLVLAGLITLSIIGAIAAIPSASLPPQVRFEREAWPAPQPRQGRPTATSDLQRPEQSTASGRRAAAKAVSVAPASQQPVEPDDWLEAITYALLALTGLMAAAVILLWRALIQWRRSADALAALAARPL